MLKFSEDDILKYFFLMSARNYGLLIHANCLKGNNLHEIYKSLFSPGK